MGEITHQCTHKKSIRQSVQASRKCFNHVKPICPPPFVTAGEPRYIRSFRYRAGSMNVFHASTAAETDRHVPPAPSLGTISPHPTPHPRSKCEKTKETRNHSLTVIRLIKPHQMRRMPRHNPGSSLHVIHPPRRPIRPNIMQHRHKLEPRVRRARVRVPVETPFRLCALDVEVLDEAGGVEGDAATATGEDDGFGEEGGEGAGGGCGDG
jgi:hypothetical protein